MPNRHTKMIRKFKKRCTKSQIYVLFYPAVHVCIKKLTDKNTITSTNIHGYCDDFVLNKIKDFTVSQSSSNQNSMQM